MDDTSGGGADVSSERRAPAEGPRDDGDAFDRTHAALIDLEETLRPDHVVHDGVAVWDLVRFPVFRRVVAAHHGWGEVHTSADHDGRQYARRASLLARNLVRRNPFLAGGHDVLFWGHPRRKRLDDGRWWDVYCDPITDGLSLDYLHVEQPHLNDHFTPARTDSLRYVDAIEVLGEAARLVGPAVGRPAFDGFDDVEAAIRERFDVEVPVNAVARRYLAYRRAVGPLYRRLLDRVDPEVAVVVVSYAGREVFIEACKERGVPVVELQHGIVDRHNYGYSYPGRVSKATFPDYLFTFGEFWGERTALPIPDDQVRPVGYPHLERSVERFADVETREQVVVVSTGEVGHRLSRLAVALASAPECDCSVVYKPHPGEVDRWREEYPWLVDAPVDVVGADGPPLHRLFAESRAQVGVYSTALYEGLRFGLETYLLDVPWMPSPPGLDDEAAVVTVDSAQGLIDVLGDASPCRDTSAYFAPDPLANVERAFEDILGRRADTAAPTHLDRH